MKQILGFLILFYSFFIYSQSEQSNYYLIKDASVESYNSEDSALVKSALKKFHAAKSDTTKIKALTKICDEMMHEDWMKFQFYQYGLIQKAIQKNPAKEELQSLNYSLSGAMVNIGYIYKIRGDIDIALEYYERSLALQKKIKDKNRMAQTLNNIGVIQKSQGNIPEAIDTYHSALKIQEEIDDKLGLASSYFNIGSIYFSQNDNSLALNYYQKALSVNEAVGSKKGISNSFNNIGVVYNQMGEITKALDYFEKSLAIKKETGGLRGIVDTYINIANSHKSLGDGKGALENYLLAFEISVETNNAEDIATSNIYLAKYLLESDKLLGKDGALAYAEHGLKAAQNIGHAENIRDASEVLCKIYDKLRRYKESLEMHKLYVEMKDSVSNLEYQRSLTRRQAQYEYEKQKALDDKEHEKQIAVEQEEKKKQRVLIYSISGGAFLLIVFLTYVFNRLKITRKQKRTIERQKKEVDKAYVDLNSEKEKSEELLLNILPEEVAEELKINGSAEAQTIKNVTVLFTDFKDFTALSEKLSAKELVSEINTCFSAFDNIMEKYRVEKIKTIGDAYMAAGGLPVPSKTHALDVVHAALDIQYYIIKRAQEKKAKGEPFFEIRIGVHSGSVVAGIVGVKKFQYDIWGDTVNTASRMESYGEVGRVNISKSTFELIKDYSEFSFESRGEIETKGKGKLLMYFVEQDHA